MGINMLDKEKFLNEIHKLRAKNDKNFDTTGDRDFLVSCNEYLDKYRILQSFDLILMSQNRKSKRSYNNLYSLLHGFIKSIEKGYFDVEYPESTRYFDIKEREND